MITGSLLLTLSVIGLALIFDFLNGFHDAANSIATVVSTRVLKPLTAVLWAATFNFVAFFCFHLQVANTIGTGIVTANIMDVYFILSALSGAIIWNVLTWYYGLPSSSSHALIGGLLGVALVKSGWGVINLVGVSKILISIVLSPLIGLVSGLIFIFLIVKLFFRAPRQKINKYFRRLQLISSALISLGHGGNDAQKTMGIIAVLLFSSGLIGSEFYVPLWVAIACYLMLALGTLCGGWRIVRTMGMKITKLQPVSGFAAETASALTLGLATYLGIPVSSTHTITGAIIGVGSLQGAASVRWGVARRLVMAWIITMPSAAFFSGFIWMLIQFL